MNWKETKLHGNPPLSRDYLVVESSCNNVHTYNVYDYSYEEDTWFCDNISVDPPVAWVEFEPYQKLFIQKFH
jgi:hypothetical protein